MAKKSKQARNRFPEMRRKFVEAFMANGGNGTQAAIAAGYSKKSAHAQASRLLKTAEVRHALEREVRNCPIVATKEERQAFWSALMRGDGPHVLLKMRDRLRASELLGKALGDFITKLQLEVTDDLLELLGGRVLPQVETSVKAKR